MGRRRGVVPGVPVAGNIGSSVCLPGRNTASSRFPSSHSDNTMSILWCCYQ